MQETFQAMVLALIVAETLSSLGKTNRVSSQSLSRLGLGVSERGGRGASASPPRLGLRSLTLNPKRKTLRSLTLFVFPRSPRVGQH